MKITVPYRYREDVIPKRCRIPRSMPFDSKVTLSIHEVPSQDAPIAIVQHTTEWDGNDRVSCAKVYRWWRNQLWTHSILERYCHAPKETQNASQFAADPYPHSLELTQAWEYRHKAEVRRGLIQWTRGLLFIDGERWEAASEPRYVLMTFGLGCNHGGTALMTDKWYNPNIHRNRYFRIDQFAQAVAETERVALNRGDTKDIPLLEHNHPDTFEILIPEAIRLNPRKEHGTGDPFINQIECVIEGVKAPTAAGFIAMGLALRDSQTRA